MPRFSIRLLLFLACSCLAGGAVHAEPHFSVGVLNQQSAIATAELWNPLLAYLGKKTGAGFTLGIGSTVQETDARTEHGEFDLAFTNHIFSMPIQTEYRPLVQWGGEPLSGMVVSLQPMQLHDLEGKTIAFPSPDAFAATVVIWGRLNLEKIKFTPRFTGSQESCLVALSKGLVDAASVTPRFAAPYAAAHQIKLHTVFQSRDFPQIPLLAHKKRVPEKLANKITGVLLDMPNDSEGRQLLSSLGIPPFKPATDAMYDATRTMYSAWSGSVAAKGAVAP